MKFNLEKMPLVIIMLMTVIHIIFILLLLLGKIIIMGPEVVFYTLDRNYFLDDTNIYDNIHVYNLHKFQRFIRKSPREVSYTLFPYKYSIQIYTFKEFLLAFYFSVLYYITNSFFIPAINEVETSLKLNSIKIIRPINR